jgi:site-specific DNA recombinase
MKVILKGQYTGGPQLYGYDVIDKKNIPNKEESQIVREIFTKFAQGLTGKAIAKRLKRRGIKTKKGHYLNNKIICKIICNPKYIGKTIHNGKEYLNIYPPIIDEDTWLSVQSVRDSYKDANCRKGILNGYLLSNKLYCGYCKHKITGSSSKVINHIIKYRYYNCLTKRNRKKESCELRTIKKEYLEKLVLDTTI